MNNLWQNVDNCGQVICHKMIFIKWKDWSFSGGYNILMQQKKFCNPNRALQQNKATKL